MVASVRAKNRNLGLCFCKRTTLNVSLDRTWFKSLPWAFCENLTLDCFESQTANFGTVWQSMPCVRSSSFINVWLITLRIRTKLFQDLQNCLCNNLCCPGKTRIHFGLSVTFLYHANSKIHCASRLNDPEEVAVSLSSSYKTFHVHNIQHKKKRFDATSVPWCRITSFGHQSLRPVCSWHKWTVI